VHDKGKRLSTNLLDAVELDFLLELAEILVRRHDQVCPVRLPHHDACPRGIEVTKAIQEVKRALLFKRF
jgi:hypothetical protein